MTRIDGATLRRFAQLVGERLTGDWVVLGGSALTLIGIGDRVTLDIDVASARASGQDDTIVLLEIALALGLPVEAVNQAAAFFLRDIPDWRADLTAIHKGPSATVHVPGPTLYVLTKIGRLSSSDLADCTTMLRHARAERIPVDTERLRAAIDRAFDAEPSPPRAERLRALRATIE